MMKTHTITGLSALAGLMMAASLTGVQAAADLENSPSRISDEPIPIREDLDPGRTPMLIEWGDKLLGPGALNRGFEIPTGAVWQPALFVFGSFRSAVQSFDDGITERSEWANRLDITANLRLTGTERLVLSLRPLDREGRFSGYQFEPDATRGSVNEFNADVDTFFFEGQFEELFPRLDPGDGSPNDFGFTLGRQPLFIQEGMLINDTIDAFGLVKSGLRVPNTANSRISGVYGWGNVHRNDNRRDDEARIAALFSQFDLYCCTINADWVYVDSDRPGGGKGWFAGVSSIQRLGTLNTAFRVLHSSADEADNPAVSTGTLLFGELSRSPTGSKNIAYLTGFYGFDEFSSAARAPATGGALGRVGILYASPGIGRSGSALSNRPNNAWGGAAGYQMFLGGVRRQLVLEAAARDSTEGDVEQAAWAVGARFQQALNKRTLVQLDGFYGDHESNGTIAGARVELLVKF
jgi:hypothetical protein